MEKINIKDYLNIKEEEDKKINSYRYPEYTYEIIFDNGSDLIIRRTSKTGIQRDLTFIPSENLVFIRDVKKGIDKPANSSAIEQFFKITNEDFRNLIKNIKNGFYKEDISYPDIFASNISGWFSEPATREFIKRGYNPRRLLSGCSGSRALKYLMEKIDEQPATIFKIIEHINKNKDFKGNERYVGRILFHAIEISSEINYNNAIWFIDKVLNSNSVFLLYALDGWKEKIKGIVDIIKKYNLNFQSYIEYLFYDLYAQGINVIDEEIVKIYDDTLNMQSLMYDGIIRDKYPKHLKEAHDKTTLIYNLNQEYFQHKTAIKLHNECKKLEYKDDDYCIITPEDSSELINEGISLHHCVGSYVKKVDTGETSILFLRKTDVPTESLITIEYQDGVIKQVRGLCERLMDEKERKFFDKWTKKFKIDVIGE